MYAPGLPSKTDKPHIRQVREPEMWDMVVQKHEAKRAGTHFDLRLWDHKRKKGHSWALRYFPGPGEQHLAIRQPNHVREYFDFEGEIPSGYGAGTVATFIKGPVEVIEASDDLIRFAKYEGKRANEFVLIKFKENNWLLVNKRSFSVSKRLEPEKLTAASKNIDDLEYTDSSTVLAAKIDGGAGTIIAQPGKQIRVFSPRKSKKGGWIEYTHKIPGLLGLKAPKNLKNTKILGEVFVESHKPTEFRVVSGILNAGIERARELQKQHGKLKIALFDVPVWDGASTKDKHYEDRLKLLKKFTYFDKNVFKLPEIARTAANKRRLVEKIWNREHPQTEEGVIEWGSTPKKIKSSNVEDVWIVDAVKGRGRLSDSIGALVYSKTKGGPPVGRIGSGFTDSERRNLTSLIGKKVAIRHLGIYPSGAARGPVLQGLS